jgi:PncC family amidohydrolase
MLEPGLVALAERLQGACLERALTVATAESCTGGLIAATLTAVPGSSGYVRGAVVSYANETKVGVLDVPAAAIAAHGAVSAQVARAMAEGCRARLEASLAVGVTGIAGPDGGTEAKPVGLTYIALASERPTEVRRFIFGGDRAAVRTSATSEALSWLIAAAEERP